MGSRGLNYEDLIKAHAAEIPSELDEWIRRFKLESFAEKSLYTVLVWIRHCAPKDASRESVALACMELQCLFILDDYEGDDYREFFGRYNELLEKYEVRGERPPPMSGTGFLAAADHFLARMASRGHFLGRYLEGKKAHLRGITWRNAVNRDGTSVSFRDYLDARITTIYVRQWMNLWEVLEGCVLSSEDIGLEDLVLATDLHCIWQVYINERVSVDRDERAGAKNLVCILEQEEGLSRSDAVRRVEALEQESLQSCRRCLDALVRGAQSVDMKRYLEIFRVCVDGTILNYGDNVIRYSSPEARL